MIQCIKELKNSASNKDKFKQLQKISPLKSGLFPNKGEPW